MEHIRYKVRHLDENGINAIFDSFDSLGDRIRRIVCGGRRLVKPFLAHRCFERTASGSKREDDGSFPKGRLFAAEVFLTDRIDTNLIQVFGASQREAGDPSSPQGQPVHSFELAFSK